jgi:hypothetical protein
MLDQAKGKVTYIENISPSQRAFFMQNKTIDKSGVMLFKADKRMLSLVDQFEKESIRRNGEKKIHPQCNIKFFNKNLYLQTPLEENDARTSWAYHFDEMNFGNLGFMKWDLRKSEARVVLVKEFVNIPIDNVMGTFSFLYSETMPFSLWTVSWIKDEIEYEFHAEDKTKNLTSFEGRKNVVRDLALNFKKALCL